MSDLYQDYVLYIDWLLVNVQWQIFHACSGWELVNHKTIGRFCHNRGHSGWWSGKFRLPLGNDGILDWDRNFPLHHAQSPLGNCKLETSEIHICDQTDRHVSSQPDTFIRSRAQFLLCSLDMKTWFLCKRKTFKKKPRKLSPLNVLTVF